MSSNLPIPSKAPPNGTSTKHSRTDSNALLDLLQGNGGEPSMFDSAAAANLDINDPQTLSAAPEPVIQALVDHHGAVELIKRLSTALAERDAHISALTRLAQEFNVPDERVVEAGVRVRRAERRRLELAAAAAEEVEVREGSAVESDSGESRSLKGIPEKIGVIRGVTKLFGGAGKRRESNVATPVSSRSTSRPPRRTDRPQSVDVRSIRSEDTTNSTEGNGWTTAIFGGSFPKRNDSSENRMPVEMTTRHDKDQLPPTLSNHSEDPQEAEWNTFLVRLVEVRQKHYGGDVSGGEMIGASHFGREGNEGRKKMEQLTRLVIGGIPMKLRHAIWMELSHTQAIMKPDTYAYYLNLQQTESDGQGGELDAILKDVPRTLTSKYDFYSGKGFARLKAVLVAFVSRYPNLGYTQGLNTIAGYLLLAIPSEEDAFWVLCNIVENFFPPDYFSRVDAMISPLADNILLRQFIKEFLPTLSTHLDTLKIQPTHTAPLKWFFTAFSNALPETTAMRVWDVWLCLSTQKNFLFAFALALLSHNAEGIMACEDEGAYFYFLDGKLDLPETSEAITAIIKVAWKFGRRLEGVEAKRVEMKERVGLETKLRRRRTGSLEVLVGGENGEGESTAQP